MMVKGLQLKGAISPHVTLVGKFDGGTHFQTWQNDLGAALDASEPKVSGDTRKAALLASCNFVANGVSMNDLAGRLFAAKGDKKKNAAARYFRIARAACYRLDDVPEFTHEGARLTGWLDVFATISLERLDAVVRGKRDPAKGRDRMVADIGKVVKRLLLLANPALGNGREVFARVVRGDTPDVNAALVCNIPDHFEGDYKALLKELAAANVTPIRAKAPKVKAPKVKAPAAQPEAMKEPEVMEPHTGTNG